LLTTILAIAGSSTADTNRERPDPTDHYRPDDNGDDYYERDRARHERFDQIRWDKEHRSRWVTLPNASSASSSSTATSTVRLLTGSVRRLDNEPIQRRLYRGAKRSPAFMQRRASAGIASTAAN